MLQFLSSSGYLHTKNFFKILLHVILIYFLIPIHVVKAQNDDSQNFHQAAVNSSIYAYALVMMDLTKQVMTNVPSAQLNGRSPINQFSHAINFAKPENRDVIRPNHDTLYSSAWLDLSKEPIVLSVPDVNDHYYLLPLLDAWTEVVYSVGKRTTGTKANDFLIVGPNWTGPLPQDMQTIKMPTNSVWITGRTLPKGIEDTENVHAIQQGYQLTPLSYWGKNYIPPTDLPVDPNVDMKTPPYEQADRMDVETFFTVFTKALISNPPHTNDTTILNDLNKIKIIPGQIFDISHYTAEEIQELERAIQVARFKIKAFVITGRNIENGWLVPLSGGRYNIDYLARAAVAYYGIGANIREDALYPTAFTDSERNLLNGTARYVLHFNRLAIPPVKGFWSVTLYGKDGYLVPNSLNRYTLGDRSPLKLNEDGSLDIYIQNDYPGIDKESNWIPAPADDFNLLMRLYWPKERILKGFWQPPEVKKQTQ